MYEIVEIGSLELPGLEVYAHLNENQLRHYYEPEAGVFIGESPNVIIRALEAGYEPLSMLMEERYVTGKMPAAAGAKASSLLTVMRTDEADVGGRKERAEPAVAADPEAGSESAQRENPGNHVPLLPAHAAKSGCADGDGPESVSDGANGVRSILSLLASRPERIPVYVSTIKVLSAITGYHLTRGILCAFRRRTLPSAAEVCRDARRVAVLDNVENPTNVGAIIRSAAALGMDAVLLTPGCADPLYRRAIRVSVGTVFQIPWTYIGVPERHYTWMKNFSSEKTAEIEAGEGRIGPAGRCDDRSSAWPERGIEQLHALGFHTAALALGERTIPIDDPRLAEEPKLALILGNEGEGLPAATLAASDYIVTIPMSHGVDSLNVAAASAVAFWQLRVR